MVPVCHKLPYRLKENKDIVKNCFYDAIYGNFNDYSKNGITFLIAVANNYVPIAYIDLQLRAKIESFGCVQWWKS
jgi:hypothetical protein